MTRAGQQSRRRTSRLIYGTGIVLILAVIYKIIRYDSVSDGPVPGPTDPDTRSFSWGCSRLEHPLMEGCEHLWLDEKSRNLYGACSRLSKQEESTSVEPPEPGNRRRDHISVMGIDSPPGQENAYNMYQLELEGEYNLDIRGLDALRIEDRLRFWLINRQPYVDKVTGKTINELKNYTVEVFDLNEETATLTHLKTVSNAAMASPKGLAVHPTGDKFLIINERTANNDLPRDGMGATGDANLAECQTGSGDCHLLTNEGFGFANDIVRDSHGHFYVPGTTGQVVVYEIKDGELSLLDSFRQSMAIDRITVNADDSIIITAFPDPFQLQEASSSPQESGIGGTVLLAQRRNIDSVKPDDRGYQAFMLIEDEDGDLMPSTTVAVHDVKTDRLFLAGLFSHGITICTKQLNQ